MSWNIKTLVNSISDIANKVIQTGKEVINKIDFNLTDIINQINAQASKNLPPNSDSYRVILTIDDSSDEFKKLNGVSLVFDLIDSKSISKSVDITTHPLVNGDLVADHMYKNATIESLSGVFSTINSDKNWNQTKENGISSKLSLDENDYLSFVQELFEFLMDNGIMMSISTAKWQGKGVGATKVSRFKERNNMVIKSINWTEKYNTMDFSLEFMEVLTAGVQEAVPITTTDPTLPAQTDAIPTSLSEVGIDTSKIVPIIINILYDQELVESKFLSSLESSLNSGEYVAVFAAGGIGAIIGVGVMALLSAGPLGLLIGAAVGLILGIAYGIYKSVKALKASRANIAKFKYYKDPQKRKKEEERFLKLISNLSNQLISKLNFIYAYKISSNTDQEMMCNIDNNTYIFKFTKNNTTGTRNVDLQLYDEKLDTYYLATDEKIKKGYYNLSIYNTSGESVGRWGSHGVLASKSFDEAVGMEVLKTSGGHYVYLLNFKLIEIEEKWKQKMYDKADSGAYGTSGLNDEYEKDKKKMQEEMEEAQRDLSNYYILDCPFDIQYFNNIISDMLEEAIINYKE